MAWCFKNIKPDCMIPKYLGILLITTEDFAELNFIFSSFEFNHIYSWVLL